MENKTSTPTVTNYVARTAVALCLAIAFALAPTQTKANTYVPNFLKGSLFEEQANRTGIDALLLYSIAITESGASKGAGNAGPTPNAIRVSEKTLDKAFYPSTRAEAEQILKELIDDGRKNIDVGLMQINLRWHGHRVSDPASLLNPSINLKVSADILYEAMQSSPNSVMTAIGRYHNWENLELAHNYAEKVVRLYQTIKLKQ